MVTNDINANIQSDIGNSFGHFLILVTPIATSLNMGTGVGTNDQFCNSDIRYTINNFLIFCTLLVTFLSLILETRMSTLLVTFLNLILETPMSTLLVTFLDLILETPVG